MDTCQCEDFHWTCSPNEEVTGPARWLTNTTDVLFDVGDFNINEWVLQTHHDFIRTRFGGWSSAFQHNGEGKTMNFVDVLTKYEVFYSLTPCLENETLGQCS